MLNTQLLLGTTMVLLSAIGHVAGLVLLAGVLRWVTHLHTVLTSRAGMIVLLSVAVLGIVAIHTIEGWVWAGLFMYLGEFKTLDHALYFSFVTSTTVGYGDVTLSDNWRLLGTFEAMAGLILFGASTAFLLATMQRLFDNDASHNGPRTKD